MRWCIGIYLISLLFFLVRWTSPVSAQSVNFDLSKFIAVKSDFRSLGERSLTHSQIIEDIDLLKIALTHGYAGFDVFPGEVIEKMMAELGSILEFQPSSNLIFCRQIAAVFKQAPDNHLKVFLPQARCDGDTPIRIPRVGTNIASGAALPWYLETRETEHSVITLLGLSRLPSADSREWIGLMQNLSQALEKSDSFVLDLRQNGGGMEQIGYEIAAMVYGTPNVPQPVEKIILNSSPLSKVFFANRVYESIDGYEARGQMIPDSLRAAYFEYLGEAFARSRGLHAPYPPQIHAFPEYQWDMQNSFRGNIYILIDSGCGSACEIVVDLFEAHPHAVLIGQNTAGTRHFGNVGLFILPHSKIWVRMPGYHIAYRDGRNIEKIGISPDVLLPDGTDALQSVLDLMAGGTKL